MIDWDEAILSTDRGCSERIKRLYEPLVGNSMLELGCKYKRKFVFKEFFESLGYRHVSVDLNGKYGSIIADLTEPLNLGTFDMVTNIGTSEHVGADRWHGQVQCWRNICEAMHVGSVFISVTPLPNERWKGHGRWYPTEAFFCELTERNGLKIERMSRDQRHQLFVRLTRISDCQFYMPRIGMHREPDPLKSNQVDF